MNRSFWLGWAVAFAIFIILIIALKVDPFFGLITNSSEAAAWVQAVGSIAAVGAAAYVPRWHDNRRKKENDDTAIRNLAADIRIIIVQINTNIGIHRTSPVSILQNIHFIHREFIHKFLEIDQVLGNAASSIRFNTDRLNSAIDHMNRGPSQGRVVSEHFIEVATEIIRILDKALKIVEAIDGHRHTAPPSA